MAVDPESKKANGLPPLTLKNIVNDIRNGFFAVIYSPSCTALVSVAVVCLTSILSKVVLNIVPYTEIDFSSYIQQIKSVKAGEIDYKKIEGDTGPIVYPAGFVHIYKILYFLTDEGSDITKGQVFFSYLLTATNFLVALVYINVTGMVPWALGFLILSKRLTSIYVLRLFNDCFTTFFMVITVLLLQMASSLYKKKGAKVSFGLTTVSAVFYSSAISTQMNALLYSPAFVIVSFFLCGENLGKLLVVILTLIITQILVGWQFLLPLNFDPESAAIRWNYISQAFNFQRRFIYKWTVNWKFVPEEIFASTAFANILLLGHLITLACFLFTRVLSSGITKKPILELLFSPLRKPFRSTINVRNLFIQEKSGPGLILSTFCMTNLIGVLFSRTLHYQFLSWYYWQFPYMLYRAEWGLIVSCVMWVLHEATWNVFPSTPLSSLLLITVLFQVLAANWMNSEQWLPDEETATDQELERKKED